MGKEGFHQVQDKRLSPQAEIDGDVVILVRHGSRRQRSFAIAFTAVAFLYLCFSISRPLLSHHTSPHFDPQTAGWGQPVKAVNTPVPLEAHIISKCPDTKVWSLFSRLNLQCSRVVLGMSEGAGPPNHATSIHESQLYIVIHRHVSARWLIQTHIPIPIHNSS